MQIPQDCFYFRHQLQVVGSQTTYTSTVFPRICDIFLWLTIPLSLWVSGDPILLLGDTHYSKWPSWAEFTLVLTHMAQTLSTVTILVFVAQTHNYEAAVSFLCFGTKQASSSCLLDVPGEIQAITYLYGCV